MNDRDVQKVKAVFRKSATIFAGALFLIVVANAEPVFSAVELSPQLVVDKVLGEGTRVEKIRLDNQRAFIGLERALGKYDFQFSLGADYTYAESETLSGLSNPLDKTYSVRTGISKLSRTGTLVSVDYNHTEQSSVLNPIVQNSRSPGMALDQVKLTVRQNLWRNAFGYGDRLLLQAERNAVSDGEMQRLENLENLALEAMRLYWKTYVSQVQLRDAIASRERYSTLVLSVRRKSRFGLERGGELTQVSAEFEDANQKAKLAAEAYLSDLAKLNEMLSLKMADKDDLAFQPGEPLPAVPNLAPVEIAKLRQMNIAKNAVDNMDVRRRSANILAAPQLDLVGSAMGAGVETNYDRAYAEMTSFNKPTYFIGVEFKTSLDSSSARAELAEADVSLGLAQNKLRSLEENLKMEGNALLRKVQAYYEVAKSAIEGAELREKTLRSQEAEYRNARIALSELIRTYNGYFESQARRVRAVGDFHVALNELAAFRDELVK